MTHPKDMPSKRVLIALLGVWLGVQPFLTARRVAVFRNDLVLWTDARDRNPDMPRARINIADAMWKRGIQHEAVSELLTARDLLPRSPVAPVRKQGYTFLVNVELGSIAHLQGREVDSQLYYWIAMQTSPQLVRYVKRP